MIQRIYDMQKSSLEKKIHCFLRFIMRHLTHKKVNIFVAMLIVAASSVFCLTAKDWDYISRSGSLVTVIGVLLMERRNLRLGPDLIFHFNRSSLDNEKAPLTDELKRQEIANVSEDISSIYWGFVLIVFGTVLWGYGDDIFQLILPLRDI